MIFVVPGSDSENLGMIAKCYFLAYDINQKRGRTELLVHTLEKAKEYQLKAIKRAQIDNTDLLEDFKKMLSM